MVLHVLLLHQPDALLFVVAVELQKKNRKGKHVMQLQITINRKFVDAIGFNFIYVHFVHTIRIDNNNKKSHLFSLSDSLCLSDGNRERKMHLI